MIRFRGFAVFGLACVGAPAAAQNGAMWVDQHGRMMSITFAGPSGAPPAPADRSAAEMAAGFKSLCLDTGGSDAATASAAAQAGLTGTPSSFPTGKKSEPASLGVWTGPGTVVASSDRFFATQLPQCNVTYYVATLPERQGVADALAAAIGSPPTNAAEAVDKKGKPRKWWSPEWRLGAPGSERIVSAHVTKGSQYMPGNRVQISVRAAKKAGK
jgi:hypothetical protein